MPIGNVVAARESTTDKVPVFCECKEKRSWYSTRRSTCFEVEVKFEGACHGIDGNGRTDCPNIAASTLHLQKGLRIRDKDEEGQSRKRQHRGMRGGGKK